MLHYLVAMASAQGSPYNDAQMEVMQKQVEYLRNLMAQHTQWMPPKKTMDIDQMREDGEWVDAEEMVKHTHRLVTQAKDKLAELQQLQMESDGVLAQRWQDLIDDEVAS